MKEAVVYAIKLTIYNLKKNVYAYMQRKMPFWRLVGTDWGIQLLYTVTRKAALYRLYFVLMLEI